MRSERKKLSYSHNKPKIYFLVWPQTFHSTALPGLETPPLYLTYTTTISSQHTPYYIRAVVAISLPQHSYPPASPVQLPWPYTANDDLPLHCLSLMALQHTPPAPTLALLILHLANHSLTLQTILSTNTIQRPFILLSTATLARYPLQSATCQPWNSRCHSLPLQHLNPQHSCNSTSMRFHRTFRAIHKPQELKKNPHLSDVRLHLQNKRGPNQIIFL